jgi:hypothetical protein
VLAHRVRRPSLPFPFRELTVGIDFVDETLDEGFTSRFRQFAAIAFGMKGVSS